MDYITFALCKKFNNKNYNIKRYKNNCNFAENVVN